MRGVLKTHLARLGLALLPWFPLLLGWFLIWDHFWGPKMILVGTLNVNGTSTEISEADQLAQTAPWGWTSIWLFRVSAVAFALGIIIIIVALLRRATLAKVTNI